jgi:predicted transposase/invertase (TIGR01784 family)
MNEKGHKKITDKLNFITIELPKFNKKVDELKNDLEVWVYCFLNLSKLKERPAEIKGAIFDQLFEIVDINKLTSEEMIGYKKSVAEYDDVQLMMECSLEEGMQKGMQKGRREGMQKGILKGRKEGMLRINEIARNLLKMNFSTTDIVQATGLTPEQIKQL